MPELEPEIRFEGAGLRGNRGLRVRGCANPPLHTVRNVRCAPSVLQGAGPVSTTMYMLLCTMITDGVELRVIGSHLMAYQQRAGDTFKTDDDIKSCIIHQDTEGNDNGNSVIARDRRHPLLFQFTI